MNARWDARIDVRRPPLCQRPERGFSRAQSQRRLRLHPDWRECACCGYRPLNVVAVGQSLVVNCGEYKEGRRRAVETYAGSSLGKHIRSLSQKIVLLRALQMGGCSRLPFTYLNGLTSSQSSRRAACLGLSAHEILRYSAKL